MRPQYYTVDRDRQTDSKREQVRERESEREREREREREQQYIIRKAIKNPPNKRKKEKVTRFLFCFVFTPSRPVRLY